MGDPAGHIAPARRAGRRTVSRFAAVVAMAALAAYCIGRYRDALLSFFFLDDFWLLRDVSALHWTGPLDVTRVFHPTHVGFELYRPLTQTGYFAFLWSLFGCDATGYHAVAILAYVGTTLLVFAIARRLTGSILAGVGASLVYATAPGHAVPVFWIAAFTITGTALIVFFTVWTWLCIDALRWRVVACSILQILALLASEHAVVAPLLLALVGWGDGRGERWGKRLRLLAPLFAIVGVYAILKGLDLAPRRSLGPYAMTADPLNWIAIAGQYAIGSVNWLKVYRAPQPGAASFCVGSALIVTALVAAWRGSVAGGPWRLLAIGIGVFLLALLPVLPLSDHFYDYFVGIAALGAALAAVGLCQLLSPRLWPSLTLALGVSLVLYDAMTGQAAARQDYTFLVVDGGSRTAAAWVTAVAAATGPGIRDVAVPQNPVTTSVFAVGHAQSVFPGMPVSVSVVPTSRQPYAFRGRAIVTAIPSALPDAYSTLPCWSPRWAWVRALGRWHLAPREPSRELPNAAPHDNLE